MNFPMICKKCGLTMSKNPHPDAGLEKAYRLIGEIFVCIPCTVLSRNTWAARAIAAEKKLS